MKSIVFSLRTYVCLGAACVAFSASAAQRPGPGDTYTVHGVLRSSGMLGPGYSVELQGGQHGFGNSNSIVDVTGEFQIMNVQAGQAVLVVRSPQGAVVHQQFVDVGPNTGQIWVNLPEKRIERPVGGTISVAGLRHKIPSKARKEFSRGEDAFEKGDVQRSIEHLSKAIEIDPEYMEAHNNLGARYMQTEQYDKAIEQLRSACKLDPGAALAQENLGAALLLARKPGDAEMAARRAKDLDPRSMRARFIVAISLVEQKKGFDEALGLLRHVASDIPRAHLYAARLLAARGDIEQAREEASKYLAGKKVEDREKVETWMASLGGPPAQAQPSDN
jgi:tetratricopeptide (TPR) repeat protein